MAVQYWLNRGEQGRVTFVSFRHGYHGDTAACMALCDPEEGMHAQFDGYLPRHLTADLPEDAATTAAFESLLAAQRTQIAGVIVEPLVQGVGGMRFHDTATLQRIAAACQRHQILLIADEIFTGFGRTGSLFACAAADTVPDILCLGKALSAGMITLAATVARTHVFDAFWSDDPTKALMHGPTYMANALACTAASASLDLFEQEPRLAQAQSMEATLRQGLQPCCEFPGVIDVRVKGAIGVVQFDRLLEHKRVRQHLIRQGVWVRSWNDHLYLTPALNIEANDLAQLMQAVCLTAQAVAADQLAA